MKLRRLTSLFFGAWLLAACDPGVHLAWEKDFDQPIDPRCVENALRTVVSPVDRGTWVSDGNELGFPRGVEVTQFSYSGPSDNVGWYQLNIGMLPNGNTRYEHEWGKLGTDIPPNEAAKILPLLNRANAAVARICNLSFAGTSPQQGAG